MYICAAADAWDVAILTIVSGKQETLLLLLLLPRLHPAGMSAITHM